MKPDSATVLDRGAWVSRRGIKVWVPAGTALPRPLPPPVRPAPLPEVPKDALGRKRRKTLPAPCGSRRGYYRHRRDGEEACRECLDALAEAHREWMASKGYKPRTPDPCGTTGAYRRHLRKKEPICDACQEAARRRYHERKQAKAVG